MKNDKIQTNKPENETNKKQLLFIIVLGFMIVIITIWGYGLKNKIDGIKQKAQESSGLLKNTKNLWDETFKSDSGTPAIITTTTWNKIVSSTEKMNVVTSSNTTTTLNSSTIDIIKKEIEKNNKF